MLLQADFLALDPSLYYQFPLFHIRLALFISHPSLEGQAEPANPTPHRHTMPQAFLLASFCWSLCHSLRTCPLYLFSLLLPSIASMNFFSFSVAIVTLPLVKSAGCFFYSWNQFLAVLVLAVVPPDVNLHIKIMSVFLGVFMGLLLFQEYCYMCNRSSYSSLKVKLSLAAWKSGI